jgi:hypothetical protein
MRVLQEIDMENNVEQNCIKSNRLFVFILLLALPMVVYLQYPLNGLSLLDSGDGMAFISQSFFQILNILDGDFAVWNKYVSAGAQAFVGGSYYPLNLLFGFLPPHWYIYFYYCFHIALGAFFLHLFLRELKCDFVTALIVSVIFLFSIHIGGARKSHIFNITAIVMLPAAIYFVQRFLNSNKIKCLAFSAVFLALAFIGAHQQVAFYVVCTVFLYYIAMSAHDRQKLRNVIKNCLILAASFVCFSSVAILHMLEIMKVYGEYGSTDTSYAVFSSFSIHPIKLIQMIFPYFFGESVFQNYTHVYSSEFDIELFIGLIALAVVLFAVRRYWEDFRIKLCVAFCAITFVYASVAHVPVLRNIVYHLPVLGGFRVPSRILPVSLFFMYVILALGLTRLRESGEFEKALAFQKKFFFGIAFISGAAITGAFVVVHLYNLGMFALVHYINLSAVRFAVTVLGFTGAILLGFALIKRFCKTPENKNKYIHRYFAATLMLVTVLETCHFSLMTSPAPLSEVMKNDSAVQRLTEDIGNAKVFDTTSLLLNGGHQSIISQNKNLLYRFAAINAYTTFNNPIMYKMIFGSGDAPLNSSGLLIASSRPQKNVLLQNDVLSMLDVKYIIDVEGFIPNDGRIPDLRLSERTLIYETDGFVLAPSSGGVSVWGDVAPIKPWHYYAVTFDIETDATGGILYADLYGGDSYDLDSSQDATHMRSSSVELLIYSDDTTLSQEDISLRIISAESESECAIKNLRLFELNFEDTLAYKTYITDDRNRIFENLNAKGILYFSEELRGIESLEDIYAYPYGLNLDKISYVIGASNETYNTRAHKIDNIDFGNNAIRATVTNNEKGFLNFSQCYFPGWKVYVDGKQENLERVNALIMGVELPPGTHEIEFKFVGRAFVWSMVVTIACTVFWIIGLAIIRKRDRQASVILHNLDYTYKADV